MRKGISVEVLAANLGVSPTIINDFEAGEFEYTIDLLVAVCDQLGARLEITGC